MTKTMKSERSLQSLPTPSFIPFHSQAFSAQSKSFIMMKLPVFTFLNPTVGNSDKHQNDLTQNFSLATSKNLVLFELSF